MQSVIESLYVWYFLRCYFLVGAYSFYAFFVLSVTVVLIAMGLHCVWVQSTRTVVSILLQS